MKAARRIGLGTVQFGLDYGITNPNGQVSETEAGQILRAAREAGIETLDTAHLYGESEAVIGRLSHATGFHIVTKTPKFDRIESPLEAAAELDRALQLSLQRLGRLRVDALLLHDANDLLGKRGGALWAAMEGAKARGTVGKIGISVYHGEQIDQALQRFPIEIVQIPYNPLDTRLIEGGQLERLRFAGVEIHARSLFLQGLLLKDCADIAPRFGPLRPAIGELHGWAARHGLTPLQAIMSIALRVDAIDRFIIGITSATELQDIVNALEIAEGVHREANFASSAAMHPSYLDPSRWGELG